MPKVELVYDVDCPNVPAARDCLTRAFAAAGLPAEWSEYVASEAPSHARGLGSPTILVDEVDVSGAPSSGPCCRVYPTADGSLRGVPDVELVTAAITAATVASR